MPHLVLLRHGQSQWNLENRFTGWTDVPLTERGVLDAKATGGFLKKKGMVFDLAFTSRLQRAYKTLECILQELGQDALPTEMDSALNERHYGSLQGLNKAETAEKYGQEQVRLWRRDFFTRPPEGESIEDCCRRTIPYFTHYILPQVESGKNVLVVASGNSLRPIIMHLQKLSAEKTASLEIGLCTPYIYEFEGDKLVQSTVAEVPGIVTKGASQTEKSVKEGTV